MTGQEFLRRALEKGLIPPDVAAVLRGQLSQSTTPVSAERMARLLQQRGYLTDFQVRQLLSESPSAGPGPAQSRTVSPPRLIPPSLQPPSPVTPPPLLTPAERRPVMDETADPLVPVGDRPAVDDLLHTELAVGATTEEGNVVVNRRRWPAWGRGRRTWRSNRPVNRWDSPLMLVGTGALIVLLLLGGAVYYLIHRGGGDSLLALAEEDYRGGSYAQAIDKYNQFLERFPRHPSASLGRVRRGLARLRQVVADRGPDDARLQEIRDILGRIEGDEAFSQARSELASLLPEFSEQLAQSAKNAADPALMAEGADRTMQALELVTNTNYVPRTLFPGDRVDAIQEEVELIRLELDREKALQEALAAMQQAVTGGRTADAYTRRKELLKQYPALASSPSLEAMVREIVLAEQQAVTSTSERIVAENDNADFPAWVMADWQAGDAQGTNEASTTDDMTVVTRLGAAFAFNSSTGQLLWQRLCGLDPALLPIHQPDKLPGSVLVPDSTRQDIACVDAATGGLKWRLPIGESFSQPVLSAQGLLLATMGGRLLMTDPQTSESTRQMRFPQPLRSPPAVHPAKPLVYQPAEQASLYVVSLDEMSCRETYYLGHAPGSIRVPPAVVLGYILVAENRGESTGVLHVLASDSEGIGLREVQQVVLQGHVVRPLAVAGRIVVVATDRGEVQVLEAATVEDGEPLQQIAQRAELSPPAITYPLIDGSHIWLADRQLIKYRVQTQTRQLVPEPIDEVFRGDVSDYPLQQSGDRIIHVRRSPERAGLTIAATDRQSGRSLWRTEFGMEPAGEPFLTPDGRLALMTSSGALFQFDLAGATGRVLDQPRRAAPITESSQAESLTHQFELGSGAMAFSAGGACDRVLIFDPATNPPSLKWFLLPEPSSCPPYSWNGGLLVPTPQARIAWVDPRSGAALAQPFLPTVRIGSLPSWLTPVGVDGEPARFVVADGQGRIYVVGIRGEPQTHLAAIAENDAVAAAPVGNPTILADLVYLPSNEGLLTFRLPDLVPVAKVELLARPEWGPFVVGDRMLVATERNELICVAADGSVRWRREFPGAIPVGRPALRDGRLWISLDSGTIVELQLESGDIRREVPAARRLASGPVAVSRSLVVAAHDGSLVVVPQD